MLKPLNVAIPLDGSQHALRAIGPARRIATTLHLGLGVVTVAATVTDIDEATLDKIVADEHLDWSATTVSGGVAAALADVAREHDAMVCMATHGHGRSAAYIGSIPDDVVRQSSMPVLLVGPGADLDENGSIRELVVAVSGEESDDIVCGVAAEWASAYGLRLRFVTIVQPAPGPLDPRVSSDRWFGPDGDEHAYMAGLVRIFEAPDLELFGDVVYDDESVAGGLAQMLRSKRDVVLVVGTRGRVGMSRFVHGSVAGDIVASSPVPVLVSGVPDRR